MQKATEGGEMLRLLKLLLLKLLVLLRARFAHSAGVSSERVGGVVPGAARATASFCLCSGPNSVGVLSSQPEWTFSSLHTHARAQTPA